MFTQNQPLVFLLINLLIFSSVSYSTQLKAGDDENFQIGLSYPFGLNEKITKNLDLSQLEDQFMITAKSLQSVELYFWITIGQKSFSQVTIDRDDTYKIISILNISKEDLIRESQCNNICQITIRSSYSGLGESGTQATVTLSTYKISQGFVEYNSVFTSQNTVQQGLLLTSVLKDKIFHFPIKYIVNNNENKATINVLSGQDNKSTKSTKFYLSESSQSQGQINSYFRGKNTEDVQIGQIFSDQRCVGFMVNECEKTVHLYIKVAGQIQEDQVFSFYTQTIFKNTDDNIESLKVIQGLNFNQNYYTNSKDNSVIKNFVLKSTKELNNLLISFEVSEFFYGENSGKFYLNKGDQLQGIYDFSKSKNSIFINCNNQKLQNEYLITYFSFYSGKQSFNIDLDTSRVSTHAMAINPQYDSEFQLNDYRYLSYKVQKGDKYIEIKPKSQSDRKIYQYVDQSNDEIDVYPYPSSQKKEFHNELKYDVSQKESKTILIKLECDRQIDFDLSILKNKSGGGGGGGKHKDKSGNTGLIIGLVFGGLALVGIGAFLFIKYRKKKLDSQKEGTYVSMQNQ